MAFSSVLFRLFLFIAPVTATSPVVRRAKVEASGRVRSNRVSTEDLELEKAHQRLPDVTKHTQEMSHVVPKLKQKVAEPAPKHTVPKVGQKATVQAAHVVPKFEQKAATQAEHATKEAIQNKAFPEMPGQLHQRLGFQDWNDVFLHLQHLQHRKKKGSPCDDLGPEQLDIPACKGEFGNEIAIQLPITYFLYSCGKLASTKGCGNVSALYWFSPDHVDNLNCTRAPDREAGSVTLRRGAQKYVLGPTFSEQINNRPAKYWKPPPFITHFGAMPILHSSKGFMGAPYQLVILNKYTTEWGGPPKNFLDMTVVRALVTEFSQVCGDRARILYAGTEPKASFAGYAPDLQDKESVELVLRDNVSGKSDLDWVRDQKHVETMQDFYHETMSGNEIKARTYSRAQCFVTTQGGGKWAFYFGGQNIVFHRAGREGSLDNLYYREVVPKFSGQEATPVKSGEQVLKLFRERMLRDGCSPCARRSAHMQHKHALAQIQDSTSRPVGSITNQSVFVKMRAYGLGH